MYFVAKGLRAWNEGRGLDAIRCFRKVVARIPDHLDFWILLADLEHEEELYAAAIRSYRRALDLFASGRGQRMPCIPERRGPTEAGVRRAFGGALGVSGALDAAEVEFRRALELEPSAESHVALGEVLESTGRLREARTCFLRALRLSPHHVEALYRMGCVHLWASPGRAERYMRRVLALDPHHAMAQCAMGLLLGRRHEWEEADRLLRSAARTGEAGALPHVYRGHNALHRGRLEEAVSAYEEGLTVAPGDPHPYFALGDFHHMEGRSMEAREAYEGALRLDPRCGDAALRLGYLCEEEGRKEEAIRYLRQGLDLAPQHPWARDVRETLAELSRGA